MFVTISESPENSLAGKLKPYSTEVSATRKRRDNYIFIVWPFDWTQAKGEIAKIKKSNFFTELDIMNNNKKEAAHSKTWST